MGIRKIYLSRIVAFLTAAILGAVIYTVGTKICHASEKELDYPLNVPTILEAIDKALGENLPEDPEYEVMKKEGAWVIAVYPKRRGDKNGGEVTLSPTDFDIVKIQKYQ